MNFATEFIDVGLVFGGVTALDGVSFGIANAGTHAIVGPNGAGKTSLLNCLSRFYRHTSGHIRLFGQPIENMSPVGIAQAGVARTFQHAEISNDLTVMENVMIGGHRWQRGLRGERAVAAAAGEALESVGLQHHRSRKPNELAHGLRKRIELARALTTRPRLLLLDEPAAGLTENEIEDLKKLTVQVARAVPVVVVAHHMQFVMAVADTVTVLDRGRLVATGAPAEVQKNVHVREAYLGLSQSEADALAHQRALRHG